MAPAERNDPRGIAVSGELLREQAERGLARERVVERCAEPGLVSRLTFGEAEPERGDEPGIGQRRSRPIDEIARTAVDGRAAAELRLPPAAPTRRDDRRAAERVPDVVEVVVELIRNASLVQVLGEAVARKNASRRLRDAAIREPVSHVDEVTETRNVGPLARQTSLGLLPEQVTRDGDPAWVVPLGWSHAMLMLAARPELALVRDGT